MSYTLRLELRIQFMGYGARYNLPINWRSEYKKLFDEQKAKVDAIVEEPVSTYNAVGDPKSGNP